MEALLAKQLQAANFRIEEMSDQLCALGEQPHHPADLKRLRELECALADLKAARVAERGEHARVQGELKELREEMELRIQLEAQIEQVQVDLEESHQQQLQRAALRQLRVCTESSTERLHRLLHCWRRDSASSRLGAALEDRRQKAQQAAAKALVRSQCRSGAQQAVAAWWYRSIGLKQDAGRHKLAALSQAQLSESRTRMLRRTSWHMRSAWCRLQLHQWRSSCHQALQESHWSQMRSLACSYRVGSQHAAVSWFAKVLLESRHRRVLSGMVLETMRAKRHAEELEMHVWSLSEEVQALLGSAEAQDHKHTQAIELAEQQARAQAERLTEELSSLKACKDLAQQQAEHSVEAQAQAVAVAQQAAEERLEQVRDELEQEHAAKLQQLSERLAEAQAESHAAREQHTSQISHLEASSAAKEQECAAFEAQAKAASGALKAVELQITTEKTSRAKLVQENSELQGWYFELQDREKLLESQNKSYQERISALEADLNRASERALEMERQLRDCIKSTQDAQQMDELLDVAVAEARAAGAREAALELHKATRRVEVLELALEAANAQSKDLSVQSQRVAITHEAALAREDREEAKREREREALRKEAAAALIERDDYKRELGKAQLEVQKLAKENNQLQRDNAALMQALGA